MKTKVTIVLLIVLALPLILSGCSIGEKSSNKNSVTASPVTATPLPVLSQSFKTLQDQVGVLAQRLDSIQTNSLSKLSDRQDSLTSGQSVQATELTQTRNTLTELQSQLSSIKSQLAALNNRLDTQQSSVPQTPVVDVVSLKSTVSALQTQVTILQNTFSELVLVATQAQYGAPSYIANISSGLSCNGPANWSAQVFCVNTSGIFAGLNALFLKVGNPGAVTLQLVPTTYSASTGQYMPVSSSVLSSGSFNTNNLGSSFSSWSNIAMTACSLTAGQYYALVISCAASDKSNYVQIAANGLNPAYGCGRAWYSTNSGSLWSAVNPVTDIIFSLVY